MSNIDALARTQLTELGRMERGYVKPVRRRGRITGYVTYCADGTYLWRFKSRELAVAAMRQQDLEPLSVH
ncbi:DUF1150 family protein [Azospirillum sp. SYSU D00513]|uniref:DUF1150 family protein n=1 Tax=Azospirillum sp. SYSU D00513 TaxID=2812561 RepID=UPI001A96A206|nr:DUF1150 family protein [Azospirillum sp. SYSU D00513]